MNELKTKLQDARIKRFNLQETFTKGINGKSKLERIQDWAANSTPLIVSFFVLSGAIWISSHFPFFTSIYNIFRGTTEYENSYPYITGIAIGGGYSKENSDTINNIEFQMSDVKMNVKWYSDEDVNSTLNCTFSQLWDVDFKAQSFQNRYISETVKIHQDSIFIHFLLDLMNSPKCNLDFKGKISKDFFGGDKITGNLIWERKDKAVKPVQFKLEYKNLLLSAK